EAASSGNRPEQPAHSLDSQNFPAVRLPALDVQSRHVVERIQSESLRLLCPELTDPLKGCEPTKTLQALGEVVGIEERGQVRSQALVGVVIETSDRGALDSTVHSLDLPIGPRVFEFREAMLDPQLRAGEVEGMGAKRLMSGKPLLNLGDRPASMRRRELKPIFGQDRVDRVRDTLDQPAQEVCRDPWGRSFV